MYINDQFGHLVTSTTDVAWRRQLARSSGGISSTCWNMLPAQLTPTTLHDSSTHAHTGTSESPDLAALIPLYWAAGERSFGVFKRPSERRGYLRLPLTHTFRHIVPVYPISWRSLLNLLSLSCCWKNARLRD